VLLLSGARLLVRQAGEPLSFDKDDDLAVEFVTAAANLRSINYSIPTQAHRLPQPHPCLPPSLPPPPPATAAGAASWCER